MRRPVILDCDPGHDDAIGILLACAHPDLLDVLAVTTVAGNQTVDKTMNNALRLLTFAKLDIKVAAGYHKPLYRPLRTAPSVHGDSGLDGPLLPPPGFAPEACHAVSLIIDLIRNSKEKVTLIPTAPMTNIAAALIGAPDIKDNIQEIVMMGGAAYGGNWTPAAEFNILVDPEAASYVFSSGVPITMIGLDVTHKALVYPDDIRRLKESKRQVATMVGELLDFFSAFHIDMGYEGTPLHDPLAVATVLDRSLVGTKHLAVAIETHGTHTLGRTVVDFYGTTGCPKNVHVALEVDRDRFMEMVHAAMLTYH